MIEYALGLVYQFIASPWLYVALFTLAMLDGFFPAIPGETALVTAAVFVASENLSLSMIILAGAAGAFAGDHAAYLIGRSAIARLRSRVRRSRRGRTAFDWADRGIAERGGQVLLASRYVPGVRTATTITMGAVRYPLRRFSLFDIIAAVLWSAGWSLVGYVGGATFGSDPIKGLIFGLGLAFSLMIVSEIARRVWRARHNAPRRIDGVSD